jgi:hypothetical protein
VLVGLQEHVLRALTLAAGDSHLDLSGVVRLALAEQLPDILREAREHREAIRSVIEKEQRHRSGTRHTEPKGGHDGPSTAGRGRDNG